jgi:hypothetical protein
VPETFRTTFTATVNGTAYPSITDDTADGIERVSPSVPAAKTGTLTTRTDANTGTLTMSSGHGFTDGVKVDVFWATGSRRNMTVGTVATNSVPVDGGSGDDLPAAATAITAMVPVAVDFTVTGNNVVLLSASAPVTGYVVFVESGPADIAAATYKVGANDGANWTDAIGTTNPLASKTTTQVKFSHGETSAKTMTAVALYN